MIASFIKKLIPSSSSSTTTTTTIPSSSSSSSSTAPLIQQKIEDNDRGYYLSHAVTDWVEYEGKIKLEEERYY